MYASYHHPSYRTWRNEPLNRSEDRLLLDYIPKLDGNGFDI